MTILHALLGWVVGLGLTAATLYNLHAADMFLAGVFAAGLLAHTVVMVLAGLFATRRASRG